MVTRSEMFRLSPDEATIVQLYRLLDEDYKVALASIATNLLDSTGKAKDNIHPFVRLVKNA